MKKAPRFLAVCLLAAWLGQVSASAGGQSGAPSKAFEKDGLRNLVRKDLLIRKKGELGFPKRNIFSLQVFVQAPAASEGPGVPAATIPAGVNPLQAGQAQAAQAEPVQPVFDFRYIGFVRSSRKVTAVVIYNGLPYSVSEGEVLSQEIRILKITAKEIEIQGPDSGKKSFSLEGERE